MSKLILKNPITLYLKESIEKTERSLKIAVPFISSYARSILLKEKIKDLPEKRIVTRFDDSFINSFDIPTLWHLLDLGFEIRFNNEIHLKLYITDTEAYVSSSNLTKGGFEDNIELTVKVNSENIPACNTVFEEIWEASKSNKINYQLLDEHLSKYDILRRREKYKNTEIKDITVKEVVNQDLDIHKILDALFAQNKDYHETEYQLFEANKLREEIKKKLKKSFDPYIFYAPIGNPNRSQSLFYNFVYGMEGKLAGTGLREPQFKAAFLHPDFEKVVNYIFPEMIGMPAWNFQDHDQLKEFCNGIFDFTINSYSEVLPIRMASFFYPEDLLGIFKLDHLKEICEVLGYYTNAQSKGDRLFAYTDFLKSKLKVLPKHNVIKGNFAYQILFTIELYNRLKSESYQQILKSYKQIWKKEFVKNGYQILLQINKA